MPTLSAQVLARPYDLSEWKKLYNAPQPLAVRRRLDIVRLVFECRSLNGAARTAGCDGKTADKAARLYLEGGLRALCAPARRPNAKRKLSKASYPELGRMVLEQSPMDYGLDRHLWTGALLVRAIELRWGVALSDSRVYEILGELGISHQRAHRDYEEADPQKQKAFVETLKKKRKK